METNYKFMKQAKTNYDGDKKKFAEQTEISEERLEEIFAGSEMSPSEAVEIAFASGGTSISVIWDMCGCSTRPLLISNAGTRSRLESMSPKEIAFAVFAGQFIRTEDGVHCFTYADNQIGERIDDDVLRKMQEKLLCGGYINYAKRLMKQDAPYTVSKLSECPMNHEQLMEYLIGKPGVQSNTHMGLPRIYKKLYPIVQFCNALESEREREEILNDVLPYVEELGETCANENVGHYESLIFDSLSSEIAYRLQARINDRINKQYSDLSDLHSDCPAAVRIMAIVKQIFTKLTGMETF